MFRLLGDTSFDFMSKRRAFFVISGVIILVGVVSFIVQGGFRLGIDFAGGRLIEYRLSEKVSVEEVSNPIY